MRGEMRGRDAIATGAPATWLKSPIRTTKRNGRTGGPSTGRPSVPRLISFPHFHPFLKGVELMPLKLTGRHMVISDATREYIDKKVNRLRRLVPKIDEMSFTLSKERLMVDIEAKFKAGKIAVQARTKAEHTHEAIDVLVDKLEAQVTKARKKLSDKSQAARKAAKADDQVLLPDAGLESEIAEEIEGEVDQHQVAGG
jgi:ribosomal subunit interface protein